MPQRDLGAVLDDDGLDYPGIPSKKHPDGKTYRVPAPDVPDGLLYTRLFDTGVQAASGFGISAEDQARLKLDGDDETAFLRKILGPSFEEMLTDGVSWPTVQKIAQDAFLCWAANEDLADLVLATRGKAQAPPNRAARRAKKAPGGKRTPAKKAGSKSSPASSGTPARTTGQASTRSSKSTPTEAPQAKAG